MKELDELKTNQLEILKLLRELKAAQTKETIAEILLEFDRYKHKIPYEIKEQSKVKVSKSIWDDDFSDIIDSRGEKVKGPQEGETVINSFGTL